jgi:hypothetical protein
MHYLLKFPLTLVPVLAILFFINPKIMENNDRLNQQENLKAENDFLKMKIMLEHGADFYTPDEGSTELSPELENEFLNNIIEFEKQFQQRRTITVFDKIGRPQHFKPVNEISDDAINDEWDNLLAYMQQYGIDLSACSPKVTTRELYRFTTEELFKHETDDINISGMVSGFIYDEFYPDYEYDNTRYAINDCIKPILCKEPLEFTMWFAKENIRINTYTDFNEEKLKETINAFKEKFDDIELKETSNVACDLRKETCSVSGLHETLLIFDNVPVTVKGNWLVQFIWEDGFWYINNVQIEGIEFI